MNEIALHFLAKMKILVVKDIEREDVEFICKVRACNVLIKTENRATAFFVVVSLSLSLVDD